MTGLGDPMPTGKKALFQPPQNSKGNAKQVDGIKKVEQEGRNKIDSKKETNQNKNNHRVRTTIRLTANALKIIDRIQLNHRLNTGKSLMKWQVISKAIEEYGEK